MTAWAPNTYQRPQREVTLDRDARSSSATGGIGTGEQFGQAHVREQISIAIRGIGPVGILQKRLPAQLVSDAQPFQRPQARDALGPVGILRCSGRRPVAAMNSRMPSVIIAAS